MGRLPHLGWLGPDRQNAYLRFRGDIGRARAKVGSAVSLPARREALCAAADDLCDEFDRTTARGSVPDSATVQRLAATLAQARGPYLRLAAHFPWPP